MKNLVAILLLSIVTHAVFAQMEAIRGPHLPGADNVQEESKWIEEAPVYPEFPRMENLLPFYVSETTSHRFMIDGSTLQVGKDRVVRYVLVVQSGGGATNISFEGMRCETREYKLYASGRQDGTWAAARRSEWRLIENKPVNRHHAALARDFFCPSGTPIFTPEEGRDALRRGKHPQAI